MLAGALWRSCCWPGRRGGEPSGISCWPGRRGEAVAGRKPLAQRTACRSSEAELHREEFAAPRKTMRLHREANKRAQKEKGPKETLISLSGHSYLLLRKLTAADSANERPHRSTLLTKPANDACERTRWRSCRCNYAGIARKVAANARIA